MGERPVRLTFEEFVEESRRSLFAQAVLLTGNREVAADVVQETYVRAHERWLEVGKLERPGGWASKVVHNLAVSHVRRDERGRRIAARFRIASEPTVPGPDGCHLDVLAALARLPERQRRAVVLHDVAGLAVAEVAQELGAPEGSIRGWLSRARAALAAELIPAGAAVRRPASSRKI